MNSRLFRKFKVLPLILLAAVTLSCKDVKKEEIETLKSEVMAIHDEMMPKMDDIYKMKKALLALNDSINIADTISTQRSEEIRKGIGGLMQAEKVMMEWMRAYRGNTIQDKDSLLAYLKNEKIVVQEMKDRMIEGMEQGKIAFETYGQEN